GSRELGGMFKCRPSLLACGSLQTVAASVQRESLSADRHDTPEDAHIQTADIPLWPRSGHGRAPPCYSPEAYRARLLPYSVTSPAVSEVVPGQVDRHYTPCRSFPSKTRNTSPGA